MAHPALRCLSCPAIRAKGHCSESLQVDANCLDRGSRHQHSRRHAYSSLSLKALGEEKSLLPESLKIAFGRDFLYSTLYPFPGVPRRPGLYSAVEPPPLYHRAPRCRFFQYFNKVLSAASHVCPLAAFQVQGEPSSHTAKASYNLAFIQSVCAPHCNSGCQLSRPKAFWNLPLLTGALVSHPRERKAGREGPTGHLSLLVESQGSR